MKTKVLFAFVALALFSIKAIAQENEKRLGFELSSGVSIATAKLNDAKLNPGLGFEGILHYRFMSHTGVYAGWGWNRFGADESLVGNDACFEETGYVFGLQFKHPVSNSTVSYYLRAGGTYNHIEIEDTEGDIVKDSGNDLGWQLAGGFDIPLGKKWSLTPGVKFNSLNTSMKFNSLDIETGNEGVSVPYDLNYITLKVGILKQF